MKLQRLFQIGKSFFFTFTLARNIDFKTLRDIPGSFAPDSCGEGSLHDHILSQVKQFGDFTIINQRGS
jgi:hypothetical protein